MPKRSKRKKTTISALKQSVLNDLKASRKKSSKVDNWRNINC